MSKVERGCIGIDTLASEASGPVLYEGKGAVDVGGISKDLESAYPVPSIKAASLVSRLCGPRHSVRARSGGAMP